MTRLTRQDFYEIIKHGIEGDKPQFQETLYYLRFFDQLGDRTRFIRWNWAAFFGDGAWMFYRRMFAFGMFVLLINIYCFYQFGLTFAGRNQKGWFVAGALYLLIKLILGVFANILYTSFIRRSLARGKVPGLVEGNVIWPYMAVLVITFVVGAL